MNKIFVTVLLVLTFVNACKSSARTVGVIVTVEGLPMSGCSWVKVQTGPGNVTSFLATDKDASAIKIGMLAEIQYTVGPIGTCDTHQTTVHYLAH